MSSVTSAAVNVEKRAHGFVAHGHIEKSAGDWSRLHAIRRAVEDACRDSGVGEAVADRLIIAFYELLENAYRCSAGEPSTIQFICTLDDGRAALEVSNQATPEDVAMLLERLDRARAGTPFDAYLAAMEEAEARSGGRSLLGLARVRYDAGMEISVTVEENVVKVTATLEAT